MRKIVVLIVVAAACISLAAPGLAKSPAAEEKTKEATVPEEEVKPKKTKKYRSNYRYYSKWIYVDNGYDNFRYRWCRDNFYPYDFYKCDFQRPRQRDYSYRYFNDEYNRHYW